MTFEDLYYIRVIAEKGSITKAAQALYIAQPTLSQRLHKVETELNTRLFQRSHFGQLKPTETGIIFLRESAEILNHLETMKKGISDFVPKKSFTVGIPIRNGHNMIAGWEDAIHKDHPEIALTFVDNKNYILEEKVAKGEIDMALVRMASENSHYRKINIINPPSLIRLREGSPLIEQTYFHEGSEVPYLDLMLLKNEPICAAPSPLEHRTRLLAEKVLIQIPDYRMSDIISVPNIYICEDYARRGIASCITSLDPHNDHGVYRAIEDKYQVSNSFDMIVGNEVDKEDAEFMASLLKELRMNDCPKLSDLT